IPPDASERELETDADDGYRVHGFPGRDDLLLAGPDDLDVRREPDARHDRDVVIDLDSLLIPPELPRPRPYGDLQRIDVQVVVPDSGAVEIARGVRIAV